MTSNPFSNAVSTGITVTSPAEAGAPEQSARHDDVVIIGSGPAGYTAAIYAARAALRTVVLEGSVDAGGALMRTTEVDNFPGFPDGVNGPDLMANMRAQAERFGAIMVREEAVSITVNAHERVVVDSAGTVYRPGAVILAMGEAYRQLGVPGEDELSAKGVSWCATCDGFFYRDKDVAVVGGGDTAVEEALFLTRFAKSVTLIHRRDALRAGASDQEALLYSNPKITIAWNTEIVSINGDLTLSSLTVINNQTQERSELEVQGLFEAIGQIPRSDLIKGQVSVDDDGYVVTRDHSTKTSVPGVFAAGDLVDKVYRQAITAAASGCQAALDAQHYLAQLRSSAR